MGKYAEQETVSDYHGFRMYQFDCGGAAARVVEPRQPLSGQWVWKGEYFEAFEEFQLRMLDRGFTLGFIDVAGNLVGGVAELAGFLHAADRFHGVRRLAAGAAGLGIRLRHADVAARDAVHQSEAAAGRPDPAPSGG